MRGDEGRGVHLAWAQVPVHAQRPRRAIPRDVTLDHDRRRGPRRMPVRRASRHLTEKCAERGSECSLGDLPLWATCLFGRLASFSTTADGGGCGAAHARVEESGKRGERGQAALHTFAGGSAARAASCSLSHAARHRTHCGRRHGHHRRRHHRCHGHHRRRHHRCHGHRRRCHGRHQSRSPVACERR